MNARMMPVKPWTFPASDETRVRRFVMQVCGKPDRLGRFLNTLSLLEHIGSRKIMASQPALNRDTLRHLAEEARHAYFFKRAAETIAGPMASYDAPCILAGPQARFYMGRLDAFVTRAAPRPAAYLYMSLIVEIRAVWFYEICQSVFRQTGQPINLAGLLAEENGHLDEMGRQLEVLGENPQDRLPAFVAFEKAQFRTLLTALEHAAGALPEMAAQ